MRPAAARSSIVVRPAAPADLAAIHTIYTHYVLTGLATFEETPPGLEEIRRRFERVAGYGLPYLVADLDDGVRGYAYAAPYRDRSAYRYAVEGSIYIDRGWQRRGLGHALLSALIDRSAAAGRRQMIAVIGDSANAASIGLHAALGFRLAGTLPSVGFKHGRWVDSVLMVRPLGEGDATLPPT
jgi:phosphinothricin acetyltransferase